MTKQRVYVTRQIPKEAIDLLWEHFEVEVNPEDRPLERKELLQNVKGKDGVLCLLNDRIDDEVLQGAGPQCKIFANYAVGYNNMDLEAASKRGVVLTNTPGVLDDATADLAWALLFSVSRRVVESDRFTRAGKFDGWSPTMYIGRDITGKTLGIIGAGRIGSNFAKKARGFDMKILYTGNSQKEDFERETGATFVDKETLLRESDFVSIHVPLMPSTKHYIGYEELKMMKDTAVLINTSRGPVVDEKALVRALKEGQIWGAGLDVFENEPEIEPELMTMDNVVIVPHIGSATIETRINMGLIAANNIIKVLKGQKPDTCVNPEVLK